MSDDIHSEFNEPYQADIVRLIREGTIRRETLIWHAGMAEWSAAGQTSEFGSLFAPRMPGPPLRPLDRPVPISNVTLISSTPLEPELELM